MTQDTLLEAELLQLECHFTWGLKKEDIDLTDLLNRLEEHLELKLGGAVGVSQTYSCLAFVRYLLGSPGEALINFKKSEELTREYYQSNSDKWLVVTYGNLAWIQYNMRFYNECEICLEKLKVIAKKFPNQSAFGLSHEVLGEKAWALFKFSRKYYERAKECFRKALELEPSYPQWNAGYAFVLNRTETVYPTSGDSQTIKQLCQALETNPDNDELRVLLAVRLAQVQGCSNEAESLAEKALEGSPNDLNVIRYVGKFFRNNGSMDRAIAIFKRALENSPNSAFTHHQLALCYKKMENTLQKEGSRDKAEVQRLRCQCIYHLEKATTLKTGFIIAMMELAVQYGEDGKLRRAENLFLETLQLAKEKNEYLQPIYLHAGDFQQYRKRNQRLAVSYYMECLKIKHNSEDGKKSMYKLNKIAERCVTRNPQDGNAWGILGFIHKVKGETMRATECYKKAHQYEANDEHLSLLCELQLYL